MRSFLIKLLGGFTKEQVQKSIYNQLKDQRQTLENNFYRSMAEREKQTQEFIAQHLRARNGHILKRDEQNKTIDTDLDVIICGDNVIVNEIKRCRNIIYAPFVDKKTVRIFIPKGD